ncbi:hypothetical protein KBB68_00225 [Candidatus Babeliales bacterium]|nr:hypothetical protein [Candidatus Babeliales bacterium]
MFSKLPFSSLQEFGADQLGLYSIQNYIEVVIFSFIIYKILQWLAQDHTKHLLLYVYAYAIVMITSYTTSCTTLFWTMFLCAPVVMIASIILHQKQLQKNFILASSKDLTPHTLPAKNWLGLLIRSCLLAAYQKKQLYCIIERTNHLAPVLHNHCPLHLALQQNVIDLIFSSNALHNPTVLWLTQTGILNTFNATWKETLINEILTAHKYRNHGEIIILTSKTDALVWSIDPTTKMAMLWHQGTFIQQLTIDQLMKSCQQILNQKIESRVIQTQGVSNATENENNSNHSAS